MNTYVAILRGVNVSGKNKLPMADLRAKLAQAGLQNIRTYIQSGNVIFEYGKSSPEELAKKIATVILKQFGFEVPVIVLTVEELSDIISNNPFLRDNSRDSKKLHVTFLAEKPQKENLDRTVELTFPPDEFIIRDRAVYVFCPNGYGRSKITNNFFEQKLKVTATTRNWKTVNKLKEIAIS